MQTVTFSVSLFACDKKEFELKPCIPESKVWSDLFSVPGCPLHPDYEF